jgi:hypothetical protein
VAGRVLSSVFLLVRYMRIAGASDIHRSQRTSFGCVSPQRSRGRDCHRSSSWVWVFCWRSSQDQPQPRCRIFSCSSPATRTADNSGRRTCSFDCSSRSLRAYIVCRAFGLYQVPSRAPDTEATETSRCTVRDTPSPRTGRFLASASAYAPGPPVRRSSAHEPHAVAAARALLSTRADLAY